MKQGYLLEIDKSIELDYFGVIDLNDSIQKPTNTFYTNRLSQTLIITSRTLFIRSLKVVAFRLIYIFWLKKAKLVFLRNSSRLGIPIDLLEGLLYLLSDIVVELK